MPATFDDIKNRILRVLNDPDGRTTTDAIVYDALCAAHEAILPWVPKTALIETSSGSDGVSVALPADVYQVQALQRVLTGTFIPKATMAPSTNRHADNPQYDWIDYPYGYLTLSREIDSSEVLKLYYLAYWPLPEDESDTDFVITPPVVCHQGIIYYAGSHCLVPRAVNSAAIRQFNQRIDSGNPEDNPLKAEAEWMLNRFMHEMKMMPAYTKVGQ